MFVKKPSSRTLKNWAACWFPVEMEARVESEPLLLWADLAVSRTTGQSCSTIPGLCMSGALCYSFSGPPPLHQKSTQLWASGWVFECCKGESLRGWKYKGFFSIFVGQAARKNFEFFGSLLTQAAWLPEGTMNDFCSTLPNLCPQQWARPSLLWQNLKQAPV